MSFSPIVTNSKILTIRVTRDGAASLPRGKPDAYHEDETALKSFEQRLASAEPVRPSVNLLGLHCAKQEGTQIVSVAVRNVLDNQAELWAPVLRMRNQFGPILLHGEAYGAEDL
jgi:hypothetical protein